VFDTVMAPARAEYGLTVTDIFRHADDSNMVLLVLDVADMEQAKELDALVDPDTRGDPDSPCAGTCKSTARLARALTAQGHRSLTTPSGVAEARGRPSWPGSRPRRALR
jgi:hypothetical protein